MKGAIKLWQLLTGLFVVIVAAAFVINWVTPFSIAGITPTAPTGAAAAGAIGLPTASATFYFRDAYNPTNAPVTTGTPDCRVYDAGVNVNDPLQGYLYQATITADGECAVNNSAKMVEGKSYQVKFYDSGTQYLYPTVTTITIPVSRATSSVAFAEADFKLVKLVGTFDNFNQSLNAPPAGVTMSGKTVTMNVTTLGASGTFTADLTVRFGNTVAGSYISNVIMQSRNDETSPMNLNAISSATMTWNSGTNYNLPGDVTTYLRSERAIPVRTGDMTSGDSGDYRLKITFDKATLAAGKTFKVYLDEQSGINAQDAINSQYGAAGQAITFTTVA